MHRSADASGSAGEAGWSEIVLATPKKVNLLELTNGVLYELGEVALPAGTYQQIRLVLVDNKDRPMANSVVPTGGAEIELKTPSGQQSGLKLNANVAVGAGETADVVLDFDACKSIVPRGNGDYNLKPVISVIPLISAGTISGYVDPALLDDGVEITAQSGGEVVKATIPDDTGAFRLYPVTSGAYDVVVTANGHGTRVVSGVPVVTGGESRLSTSPQPLALVPSATGDVSGAVTPVAALASVRALQVHGATSLRIEVVRRNADALSGAYAFSLPLADLEVAPWNSGTLPLSFGALAGTGGRYLLEASATGYATALTPELVLGPTPLVQDFVLTPAP